MKRLWFTNLAMMLSLCVVGQAFGQYPYGYNNGGASSYPIQNNAPSAYAVQNLPQVPQAPFGANSANGAYQLTGMQEQVPAPGNYQQLGSNQPLPMMSQPAPSAPMQSMAPMQYEHNHNHGPAGAAGCATCNQSAAPMNYGFSYPATPTCNTCGPTPVSQSYSGPALAPAQASFTAPSVFGTHGGGHFGGGHGGYGGLGGHGGLGGGLPAGAKPWFFNAGVLLFKRVDDHSRVLSFRDSDTMPVLSTGDARSGVLPGFEAGFGRYFNCGKNAIAVNYWGLFPETEMASVTGNANDFRSSILRAGDFLSPVDQTGATVPYDPYDWYDTGLFQRVDRSFEVHSVEVNLLGFAAGGAARNFNRPVAGTMFSGTRSHCGYCGGAGCGSCGTGCGPAPKFATGPCCLIPPSCGSRLNVTWLAGFRYFRFEDNLQYAASIDNAITRSVDDFYYNVDTTNDLFGFQIGGRGDYCLGRRLNLYIDGKSGVFGNHSTLHSRLGTDTQVAYVNGMPTEQYLINSSKNQIAFLSEIGTGLGFNITPKWTATCGYRAVIASGVATSVGNIRGSNYTLAQQSSIDSLDTLILHGVNLGASYNF